MTSQDVFCGDVSSLSHYFDYFYTSIFFLSPPPQFGGKELRDEEQTAESIKNQMTVKEWEKVFEMSQDKNLYHNLCTSLGGQNLLPVKVFFFKKKTKNKNPSNQKGGLS